MEAEEAEAVLRRDEYIFKGLVSVRDAMIVWWSTKLARNFSHKRTNQAKLVRYHEGTWYLVLVLVAPFCCAATQGWWVGTVPGTVHWYSSTRYVGMKLYWSLGFPGLGNLTFWLIFLYACSK